MVANISPIFGRVPQIEWGATTVATANTAKDGTGTVLTAFTADATEGSFLQYIALRAAGSNIASVARIFINNGASNATPANNILFTELSLPATTGTETAQVSGQIVPMNIGLPAGYRILITLGTTVATGYYVTGVGSKY